MPKKWGQHFLIRQRYIDQLLEVAHVSPEDNILEIGPGKGGLTSALLHQKSHVTAVEIDPDLYQFLTNRFLEEARLSLIQQDILQCDPAFLATLYPHPYKVVANLPYNISAPIFFKLLDVRQHLKSITVMVQKEVAQRLCATVKERKSYGVLSIAAEIGFERQWAFSIPPSAFSPPPKVDSAVVHLTPKPGLLSEEEEGIFLKWIQMIFNQRRKTLLNNLQRCAPNEFAVHQTQLKKRYAQKRAETLTLEELIALFHFMQPTDSEAL